MNYVQYGKCSKSKNNSKSGGNFQGTVNGSSGSSGNTGNPSKSGGKDRKVPLPMDICWRCGKGRHKKGQPVKQWKQCVGTVTQKDIMRMFA